MSYSPVVGMEGRGGGREKKSKGDDAEAVRFSILLLGTL
jgi:hypothetical protein